MFHLGFTNELQNCAGRLDGNLLLFSILKYVSNYRFTSVLLIGKIMLKLHKVLENFQVLCMENNIIFLHLRIEAHCFCIQTLSIVFTACMIK